MLYEYNQRVWGHILEDKALKNGDQTFLHFYARKISYAELNKECTLIAKGLLGLGVKKGDKVCIMMDNQPEYLYAWLGASRSCGYGGQPGSRGRPGSRVSGPREADRDILG